MQLQVIMANYIRRNGINIFLKKSTNNEKINKNRFAETAKKQMWSRPVTEKKESRSYPSPQSNGVQFESFFLIKICTSVACCLPRVPTDPLSQAHSAKWSCFFASHGGQARSQQWASNLQTHTISVFPRWVTVCLEYLLMDWVNIDSCCASASPVLYKSLFFSVYTQIWVTSLMKKKNQKENTWDGWSSSVSWDEEKEIRLVQRHLCSRLSVCPPHVRYHLRGLWSSENTEKLSDVYKEAWGWVMQGR